MGIKKAGFTLLEMMIALSIIALLVPAMFGLFFVNLRAQSKVLVLQEVKRNGDNALNVIESLVKRSAKSLHSSTPPTSANEICTSSSPDYSGGNIYMKDASGDWFAFYVDENKIASESSTIGISHLTNSKVIISNFSLTCTRTSEYSLPLISISFSVDQSASTNRQEEQGSMDYQTKIKLRSY